MGNICKIIDASGTRNITYNSYNERETDAMALNGNKHTITETMDTLGRSTGYVLDKNATPLDTISYAYSQQGRLAKTSFRHEGQQKTFEYSSLPGTNLLHSIAHPNNILVTRTYEERRELPISINATRGNTNVVLLGYTYDQLDAQTLASTPDRHKPEATTSPTTTEANSPRQASAPPPMPILMITSATGKPHRKQLKNSPPTPPTRSTNTPASQREQKHPSYRNTTRQVTKRR